jgi:hypothetical protein
MDRAVYIHGRASMTVATTGEGDRTAIGVGGELPNAESRTETARAVTRVGADALKAAARAGVEERYARLEDRSKFGCVDWYLYPHTKQ